MIIREIFGTTQITVDINQQCSDCFYAILKTVDVQTTLPKEGLRINLLQGKIELESNRTVGGRIVFEGLKPREYFIQVFQRNQIIGTIKMSLKRI